MILGGKGDHQTLLLLIFTPSFLLEGLKTELAMVVAARLSNVLFHVHKFNFSSHTTKLESSEEDVHLRRRRRGLLRMYYGVNEHGGGQQAENPLDIVKAGFKPDVYMEKTLRECSLNELYRQEGRMKKGLKEERIVGF